MTVGLSGKDPAELRRWETLLGRSVNLYSAVDQVPAAEWVEMDLHILDLQSYRQDTGDPHLDEDAIVSAVTAGARQNPDCFWLILSPPGLSSLAVKVQRELASSLSGKMDAVAIAIEPNNAGASAVAPRDWLEQTDALNAIALEADSLRALTPSERRCIRRLLPDAQQIEVKAIGNGQSGALILAATRRIRDVAMPALVVKIGPADELRREHLNFIGFVKDKIVGHHYPARDSGDTWYVGAVGGVKMALADCMSLAQAMREGSADLAVGETWDRLLRTWLDLARSSRITLGTFVDAFVSDLSSLQRKWEASPDPSCERVWNPIGWLQAILERPIVLDHPLAITHGDLHGFNILVDSDGHAWLIDYSQIDERPAIFDFAYCECALLIHELGMTIVVGTDEEVKAAEDRIITGGDGLRRELDLVRKAANARFGQDATGILALARGCSALNWLKYDDTNAGRAKIIASTSLARVRELNPDWESLPPRETITL